MKEKRRHPRRKSAFPLKIKQKGIHIVSETINVSSSGLYCQLDKALPLMSKVKLTLLLPVYHNRRLLDEKVDCEGVVVRTEPVILENADHSYHKVAIFFTGLSQRDKEKVACYVSEHSGKL